MNAAVAYYLAADRLSTSGSPHPWPPRRSGEPRRQLTALLVAVVVVLAAALGALVL